MNKGLVFAVLASLFFSLMNVFAKYLSNNSIGIMEIAFYRGIIGIFITSFFIYKNKENLKGCNWLLLGARGLLGAISILFAFFTISKIDLVEASFIAHLSPVITILLAKAILRESLPPKAFWGVAIAVLGTIFITSPWERNIRMTYVLIGISGAFFTSFASISIRQLSKNHGKYIIILAFLLASAILPIPFIKWTEYKLPSGMPLIAVLGIGIISFLGQYFLTLAYKFEKAGLVAATRYIGIVFSLLFGYYIWSEVPAITSFIGGGLIIFACFALSFPKIFTRKNKDLKK